MAVSWYAMSVLWRFSIVGNVVGCISKVNQRRTQLVFELVGKPSPYVASHPGQLSFCG